MLLKDCKKASIYSLKHIFLCDARVSNIQEDSVTLTMDLSSADFLTSEIYVTFYDSIMGLVTFFCVLTEYKEDMLEPGIFQSQVHCAVKEQISVLQRRSDIKTPVHIPVVFQYESGLDAMTNVKGIIRNISAGGIFFTCHHIFLTQTVVRFQFSPGKSLAPLDLQAQILRMQDPEGLFDIIGKEAEEEKIRGYGCRFIRLSPHAESQIRNYVFRADMIHRRKLSPVN